MRRFDPISPDLSLEELHPLLTTTRKAPRVLLRLGFPKTPRPKPHTPLEMPYIDRPREEKKKREASCAAQRGAERIDFLAATAEPKLRSHNVLRPGLGTQFHSETRCSGERREQKHYNSSPPPFPNRGLPADLGCCASKVGNRPGQSKF